MLLLYALHGHPFPLAVVVVGFSQTLFTVSEAQQTVNVSVELLFGTTDVGFGVIVSTVNDFDAVGQWSIDYLMSITCMTTPCI